MRYPGRMSESAPSWRGITESESLSLLPPAQWLISPQPRYVPWARPLSLQACSDAQGGCGPSRLWAGCRQSRGRRCRCCGRRGERGRRISVWLELPFEGCQLHVPIPHCQGQEGTRRARAKAACLWVLRVPGRHCVHARNPVCGW